MREHIIFDKKVECASRKEIQEMQLQRLKKTVEYCYEKVPHYKKKFDQMGLKPSHIKSLKDIRLLPFTTKDDLRENYPFGMFAVPKKDVVRIHASSGTTGKPTVVGYTKKDLEIWSDVVARLACAAGVTPDDTAQISFGYGLFTGGFGLHYGLEKVGVSVIPVSSGNTARQLMLMQDFESTVLISTPSYALYMSEVALEKGIDTKKLPLRIGLFGGEGHTDAMRRKIEQNWNILATENYGLSEVIGPGMSGECYIKDGMHIAEDHFYTEIVDEDLNPLPMGEKGEVVVTSLTKEAFPVLRYRTKDISYLFDNPCECGRTSLRMSKIQGRTDDMMIIRGVNVFPSQIEEALMNIKDVGAHYEIVLTTENNSDNLEVRVEVADDSIIDNYRALQELTERIKASIYEMLNIKVKVTLVSPQTLTRFEGKAKRVIDNRNR